MEFYIVAYWRWLSPKSCLTNCIPRSWVLNLQEVHGRTKPNTEVFKRRKCHFIFHISLSFLFSLIAFGRTMFIKHSVFADKWFNPLSANLITWSNTLKTIHRQFTNLALKGLTFVLLLKTDVKSFQLDVSKDVFRTLWNIYDEAFLWKSFLAETVLVITMTLLITMFVEVTEC